MNVSLTYPGIATPVDAKVRFQAFGLEHFRQKIILPSG